MVYTIVGKTEEVRPTSGGGVRYSFVLATSLMEDVHHSFKMTISEGTYNEFKMGDVIGIVPSLIGRPDNE